MKMVCPPCGASFTRTDVAPGDAVMCPRCRSLVVARAPVPAIPVSTAVAATAAARAPATDVRAVHGRQEERRGAGGERAPGLRGERVALLRTCPGCGARYDIDSLACPACGKHVKMVRLEQSIEADQRSARWEMVEAVLYLVGGLVVLVMGGFALRGEDLEFLVMGGLALLLLGYRFVAWLRARRRARALRPRS